jgi:FecR protein
MVRAKWCSISDAVALPLVVIVGTTLALLLLIAGTIPAEAQTQGPSATVTTATGRVEILRKDQTVWIPAPAGSRLVEGDQIRAFAASSAELSLPDGGTILVSENTRLALTRLSHDQRTGVRDSAFHVVVGKVRAEVTRAGLQLVRARQSNFAISTPGGVAGVRGTIMVVGYNPAAPTPAGTTTRQVLLICLPSRGQNPFAAVCTYFDPVTNRVVLLRGNQFIIQIPGQPLGAPSSIANLPWLLTALLSTVNPETEFASELTDPFVILPSFRDIDAALRASVGIEAVAAPPVSPLAGSLLGDIPVTSITSTNRDTDPTNLPLSRQPQPVSAIP